MNTNNQPLIANHKRISEFLKNYDFTQSFLGKKSPQKLKKYRFLTFSLYCILGIMLIVTYQMKLKTWYITAGIALIIDVVFMIRVYIKTNRYIIEGFHSLIFKKWYEIDMFIKNDLQLNNLEREKEGEICLNLANFYKRNYYQWGMAVGVISVFVSIIAVEKNATPYQISELTFLFSYVIFGLWYFAGNVASSLDKRSERYLDIYLIISELNSNKQYQKLKDLHEAEDREDI